MSSSKSVTDDGIVGYGEALARYSLGSMGRDRIPVNASSVSWASDDTAIAQTEAAVRRGFSMIKIKIGPPVEKALARAGLVREVAGDDAACWLGLRQHARRRICKSNSR